MSRIEVFLKNKPRNAKELKSKYILRAKVEDSVKVIVNSLENESSPLAESIRTELHSLIN